MEYLQAKGRSVSGPRVLRNLISRALAGEYLTKETLELFIEAFDMAEEDAQKLLMLFAGFENEGLIKRVDWTADPHTGRSNSSPAFQKAVEGVETLIRARFPEKSREETRELAVQIVAYLAHGERLEPRR